MSYDIVEIKPMQENTREELDRYLADICQVVRDKDIKNPHSLTERLMKESYGDNPSSVFTFVPCIMNKDTITPTMVYNDFIQSFGLIEKKTNLYHTNLRELLNLGIGLDAALQYVDFTHYKVFTARVPYFVYQQIRTHSQVQFLSHSARYSDVDYGYFMPDGVKKYLEDMAFIDSDLEINAQPQWNHIVPNSTPNDLIDLMKKAGVKRKEIYNRGVDMLKIRPFTIGFNTLNPNSWEHFYNQRGKDPHTQLETRNFVNELIKYVKER